MSGSGRDRSEIRLVVVILVRDVMSISFLCTRATLKCDQQQQGRSLGDEMKTSSTSSLGIKGGEQAASAEPVGCDKTSNNWEQTRVGLSWTNR